MIFDEFCRSRRVLSHEYLWLRPQKKENVFEINISQNFKYLNYFDELDRCNISCKFNFKSNLLNCFFSEFRTKPKMVSKVGRLAHSPAQVYPGLCTKESWPNCGTGTNLALAVPIDHENDVSLLRVSSVWKLGSVDI